MDSRELFTATARAVLDEVLPLPQPVRLMGVTLSALEGDEPEVSDVQRRQLPLL